ncbi:MAG: 50S ribosomal protein L24 [Bdellovibrionales bacterium RBG_16_40_8]|nr:MAG: 50S ribosomal protein L24 [Bdellovibrionales bacterium RBG_16_40_8]
MKLRIKKGDTVQVTAGAQKGIKGSVMSVDLKKMRIKVQGVRIQTNFDKKEGILKSEGYIDYSNVKLVERAVQEKKKTTKGKASSRK